MPNKNYLALFIVFVLKISILFAQNKPNKISYAGFVIDQSSGEALINATIRVTNSTQYSVTDTYGHFNLSINNDNKNNNLTQQTISVEYLGFKTLYLTLLAQKDTSLVLQLEPNTIQEVVITATPNRLKTNVVNIPVERLKAIPSLLGQPDLIKALTFIPGVSAGVEGTTGLFVRGGTPDQNLILLDGATVYNASHLFGFQSVFDPSAIKDVKLFKGGFPARYGGRLSSVIDITMKEGNNQQRKSESTLGLINSSFMTEGPIRKGVSSYMVSGRASYWGLLTLPTYIGSKTQIDKPFVSILSNDLNAKINHQFKNKDKIFASFYLGDDDLVARYKSIQAREVEKLGWGNRTLSLRYTHAFNEKCFSSTLLNYNQYRLKEYYEQALLSNPIKLSQKRQSGIQDFVLKQQVSFSYGNNHLSVLGVELLRQKFNPGNFDSKISVDNIDSILFYNNLIIKALNINLFLENEWHLGKNITISAGLRGTQYEVEGKKYIFPEPRTTLDWRIGALYYALSYARTTQFIHLLSTNINGLNSDVWVPSTAKIKPQVADVFSTGLTWRNAAHHLEFALEGYYKTMNNQIDYRQGINFFDNSKVDWQQNVVSGGKGRAYGMELMLQKEALRYNGWLSYTLSKNERQFEQISYGAWYPHRYDRKHILNLTISYKINQKWDIASNFVYQTGSRITLPTALQLINEELNQHPFNLFPYETFMGARNNQKLPPYHRLDISFNKKYLTRKRQRAAQLSIGAYNVYARANPSTIWLSTGFIGGRELTTYTNGKSLFTFIPSIAYSLKW
ncbi:MAG: hypothetical protein RLZZ292_3651 [Bacteroidota bacterium]|jgi:outer membrane receptor for ferrienterochelin and colicin